MRKSVHASGCITLQARTVLLQGKDRVMGIQSSAASWSIQHIARLCHILAGGEGFAANPGGSTRLIRHVTQWARGYGGRVHLSSRMMARHHQVKRGTSRLSLRCGSCVDGVRDVSKHTDEQVLITA